MQWPGRRDIRNLTDEELAEAAEWSEQAALRDFMFTNMALFTEGRTAEMEQLQKRVEVAFLRQTVCVGGCKAAGDGRTSRRHPRRCAGE